MLFVPTVISSPKSTFLGFTLFSGAGHLPTLSPPKVGLRVSKVQSWAIIGLWPLDTHTEPLVRSLLGNPPGSARSRFTFFFLFLRATILGDRRVVEGATGVCGGWAPPELCSYTQVEAGCFGSGLECALFF